MFPKAKYAAGGAVTQVNNEMEEKKLGKGWYDHPNDALAGRVLTNQERGDYPNNVHMDVASKAVQAIAPTKPKE